MAQKRDTPLETNCTRGGSGMTKRQSVAVLTYNGVDGACAAAMALLKHPDADVVVTSAARIGRALSALAERSKPPQDILVCGIGVYCPWPEVSEPALKLRKKSSVLSWYCGRGYLEPRKDDFAALCRPVFGTQGTNTACVCEDLGLGKHPKASPLLKLACQDPHIQPHKDRVPAQQAFWIDLIQAAIAEYFKYQDEETYVATIGKLSRQECDESDRKRVDVFRRSGFAHVLWGDRTAMGLLRATIRLCAEVDEPVLIVGESGTGKEYVSHLIHERSARAMGPLIPVNCALFAGDAPLANSTLFGHVKGAFTGAMADRDGAFVSADSGILFLDEVAELPPEVQAKLLRVLEDGWVTPEGSDQPRKVDVRVVAATNRDLPTLIRKGTFRADLYHRLDTLLIRVPPLHDHVEDVDAIARQLLPTLVPEGKQAKLSAKDVRDLRSYDWPGNVRQLIKVLKRSVYLGISIGKAIDEERQLGPLVEESEDEATHCPLWPLTADQVRSMDEVRSVYAARAVDLHAGNIAATARALGIAINTLRSYVTQKNYPDWDEEDGR
jgi:DNA-binding NtrC family response regulator